MSTAESKILSARSSLVLDNPFFGALALGLPMKADPTCKTAWTNGRELGYNPTFVESLNQDELTGVVGHEVYHCAMGHPWRRDGRDMKMWNIACDKAINTELRNSGFKLPEGALYAEGDEIGKSAEWIFARMRQEEENAPEGKNDLGEDENEDEQGQSQQQSDEAGDGDDQSDGQGDPNDSGDPLGEVRDAPTTEDVDGTKAPTEQDWKQRVVEAMHHAKMMGEMPGGMERQIAKALKPRVDVRSLLLRFFSERATGDYSWSRPNTRYIAQGLYLPSLESRELGEIAIMVDTSGSVDETSLSYARGIVESVIEECSPLGVAVYYADAQVKRVDHFAKGDPLDWQPAGGGGTDFRPALKAIEDDGSAVCAICITDLAGRFPESEPEMPVLWLSTEEDAVAPFGETVYVDR